MSRELVHGTASWLGAIRRYALFTTVANLAWESAHVQLYTLWETGTLSEVAFSVVHCTMGDLVIAAACLLAALSLLGDAAWPMRRFARVAIAATVFGVAYTVYSEQSNLARGAWAYSEAMPLVPPIGIGLSPLLQWILVPPLGFAAVRHPRRG